MAQVTIQLLLLITNLKMKTKKTLLTILIIIFLLAAVGASVYLVSKPQIFKSRASTNLSDAFEITDNNGNAIICQEDRCATKSLYINFKINNLTPLKPSP